MKKFKIKAPIHAFLHITVESPDKDDAIEYIDMDTVYKTSNGIATKKGVISLSLNMLDWREAEVEEVKTDG